jgi:hypothetical protein
MRFIRSRKGIAGELRGEHIAAALGVPCETEYSTPDEWVIFVKTLNGVQQAKRDGCRVVFDPVDAFCYPGHEPDGWPSTDVDLLIIPNRACAGSYRTMFPNADYLIIPHQWDSRITGMAEHDEFRPGYIGSKFNLRENLGIPIVVDDQLAAMPRHNCHVGGAVTPDGTARKPATKVASASAVGSVIVTAPDASAVELLGPEYPFYAKSTLFNALFKARKLFGSEAWNQALEILRTVREKTSLAAVAAKYEILR